MAISIHSYMTKKDKDIHRIWLLTLLINISKLKGKSLPIQPLFQSNRLLEEKLGLQTHIVVELNDKLEV